jgi:hypothetical protein
VTSLLSLLSNSISSGQPLPPYLIAPSEYGDCAMPERLSRLRVNSELGADENHDHPGAVDILSVDHLKEPGYAAFAVMQVANSCLADSLQTIVNCTRELVGEVDFGFHIVEGRASGSTLAGTRSSQEGKKEV